MPSLFDALEGLSRGVSDADKNLGLYLKHEENEEDRELDRAIKQAKLAEILQKRASLEETLLENEKKAENLKGLVDRFYQLYGGSTAGVLGKLQEKAGDLGIASDTSNKRKEANVLREELIGEILKQKGLPKTKQTYEMIKKEITPSSHAEIPSLKKGVMHLIGLDEEEEDVGIDSKLSSLEKEESPMEKDLETVIPVSEDDEGILKKIGKSIWKAHKPIREINKSMVKGLGNMGKGALKLAFAPMPDFKNEIDVISENLGKKYNEKMGIKEGSWEDIVGTNLGEMMFPIGGLLKGAKWLPKVGKAMLGGGLFGALKASAENENIPKEALTGAAISGVGSKVAGKLAKRGSKAKLKKFEDIRKGAHITDPEEILKQAEILGEGATIAEAVQNPHYTEKLRGMTSRNNKARMKGMSESISKAVEDFEKDFPNEPRKVFKSIEKNFSKAVEDSNLLYDTAKEIGIGQEGILNPKTLKAYAALSTDFPGAPPLKMRKGSIDKINQELKQFVSFSMPRNALDKNGNLTKEYKSWYIQNFDELPNAEDLLKFRKAIKNIPRDTPYRANVEQLEREFGELVEKNDPTGKMKKAIKNYAEKVAPYQNQKEFAKEVKNLKYSDTIDPALKFFEKDSYEVERIFNDLPKEDKRRVIAGLINSRKSYPKETLSRAIAREDKRLPSYMRNSKDPEVQKMVKEFESLSSANKALTGIQTAMKDKGSATEVKRGVKKLAPFLAGYAARNPAAATLMGGAYLGRRAYEKALLRQLNAKKNLKYYLKPELLETIAKKQEGRGQDLGAYLGRVPREREKD